MFSMKSIIFSMKSIIFSMKSIVRSGSISDLSQAHPLPEGVRTSHCDGGFVPVFSLHKPCGRNRQAKERQRASPVSTPGNTYRKIRPKIRGKFWEYV